MRPKDESDRSLAKKKTVAAGMPGGSGGGGRNIFRAVVEFGRRHIVLRFILGVILLMGLFYAVYLPKWEYDIVDKFLHYNLAMHAYASSAVLNLFGNQTQVYPATENSGPIVRSPRFSMEIVRGCDALEPLALFLAAVIAFPVGWKKKLIGAAFGILFMELTNVVRLVTLFYVGVYWRQHFEMMHVEVWQAGFIVLSVVYWGAWALWATRPPRDDSLAPASTKLVPSHEVQPTI